MRLTEEQNDIIQTAKTGVNIAINAFAGAAKTSTCIAVAHELQHKSLYIAFNKSVAEEATGKFPSWVDCRTLHSLAFRGVVFNEPRFKEKIRASWDYRQIRDLILGAHHLEMQGRTKDTPYFGVLSCNAVWGQHKVARLISMFCQTAGENFSDFLEHVHYPDIKKLREAALYVWDRIIDPNTGYVINHDVYLKLFQLSKPDLSRYKTVYLDEAQDSNPVTVSIVLSACRSGSQLIMVGDPYQGIYAWRGAINAFSHLGSTLVQKYLTKSFRFGSEIAGHAQVVLEAMGETKILEGNERQPSDGVKSKAYLFRTNADIYSFLKGSKEGDLYYVVADMEDLFVALRAADGLRTQCGGDSHPLIDPFDTYAGLKDAVPDSPELMKIVTIIEAYDCDLDRDIPKVRSHISLKKTDQLETLCTAHKAKGLEWDIVVIPSGLVGHPGMDRTWKETLERDQCGNLFYVALTRAKEKLVLSYEVLHLLQAMKMDNYWRKILSAKYDNMTTWMLIEELKRVSRELILNCVLTGDALNSYRQDIENLNPDFKDKAVPLEVEMDFLSRSISERPDKPVYVKHVDPSPDLGLIKLTDDWSGVNVLILKEKDAYMERARAYITSHDIKEKARGDQGPGKFMSVPLAIHRANSCGLLIASVWSRADDRVYDYVPF